MTNYYEQPSGTPSVKAEATETVEELRGLLHTVHEARQEALAGSPDDNLKGLEELLVSWPTLQKIRWDIAPGEALKDPHQQLAFAVEDYLAAQRQSRRTQTQGHFLSLQERA